MASSSSFSLFSALLLLVLSCLLALGRSGGAATFVLDVHHRFSDEVRRWAESTSWETRDVWPEKGTLQYYASLVEHDRALLHRRGLAGGGGTGNHKSVMTFKDGNATIRLNRLGFLHYTVVSLGTPPKQFLVALDTGSNLFWVPCDCNRCARARSPVLNVTFNIFNSTSSITNKRVPCNSGLCATQSSCTRASDPCPYTVEYLSSGVSTSGILLQDVLHLTTEGGSTQEPVQAAITFGCGQVQTGDFLRDAAPNGLLGLGMGGLSIPSALAAADLTPESFSMCFSPDGIGRIRFGDNGSVDQQETPLIPNKVQIYAANVTGIQINDKVLEEKFPAFIDSGSSFTILTDPMYTNISEAFNSLVRDGRHPPISGLPFEYCYNLSSNETPVLPNITLLMKGGSRFPIIQPEIIVVTDETVIYCLAILKSNSISIIGQNFLTGLRVVFDSQKSVLGWKVANCYDTDVSSASSPSASVGTPPGTSPSMLPRSPSVSVPPELSNHSIAGNNVDVRVPPPSPSVGRSLSANSFLAGLLPLSLLFFA